MFVKYTLHTSFGNVAVGEFDETDGVTLVKPSRMQTRTIFVFYLLHFIYSLSIYCILSIVYLF
jgi:hypothetical protein